MNETLDRFGDLLARTSPGIEIRRTEPLSKHTSFRIGGPADIFLIPTEQCQLLAIARAISELKVPCLYLGKGSNLLVRDGGVRGVVVKIAENFSRVEFEGKRCSAHSGALLAGVSRGAAARGLRGLEFACGIPGSIGGGVMMNAGAYGGEMRDVVTHVTVVTEDGILKRLPAGELEFGYRKSVLQSRTWLVTNVEMDLCPDDPERTLARMSVNQYLRESKQPLDWPSAGSVFKRPPGKFVGPMIQALGLKGAHEGGAQISEKHAGFIINVGGASAADVLALIRRVRDAVWDRYQVMLETEIRIVGEDQVSAASKR